MIIYERKGPLKADHVELERKRRVGVGLLPFYCAQREGVANHLGGGGGEEGWKEGGRREEGGGGKSGNGGAVET